jgi:hypothetical protein
VRADVEKKRKKKKEDDKKDIECDLHGCVKRTLDFIFVTTNMRI